MYRMLFLLYQVLDLKIMKIGHNELAPNREAVVAVPVVGRIDVATVEVQVVAVGGAILGRGPVDALVTDVDLRPIRAIDVTGTRWVATK